ncbi:MAG: threonine--tRNA ligase, partial [Firmicutes bacterium]|nr:threonine--tRNA ligase [Bacillota bacterium]
VKNIYPTVKLGFGPAIKNGFYYDFDFDTPISQDDFAKIEAQMQAIIKADFPIIRKKMTKKAALSKMKGFGEHYKVELIGDLKDGSISFYEQGNFIDLCAGPHLMSTGKLKHFKLINLAGAYWRGSEKNKMLTRIYGTAFEKKNELEEHLTKLEEAKKRDHNKLGRELGYFMTEEKIGQGLPLIMPKGATLFNTLVRFVEDEEVKRGYQLTKTPFMAKNDLYKLSGHWELYKDGMFVIGNEDSDDEILALRPMTCPFQYMIYKNGLKSYRDLPVRYNETSTLFRNESSGEMHGLIRVRQFTLSEGHIICTSNQFEEEFKKCLNLIYYMLDCLGFAEDVSFRFSKRDPDVKGKYIDDNEAWERAEGLMKQILDDIGLNYVEAIGDAAFYGPKLDIQMENVFGKEDTILTIQVDMFLAKTFDMTYVEQDGSKKHPYIIHRTSIGCYERTMALLLEKYAGALPFWMAPEQIRVLALTDRNIEYATTIANKLKLEGYRVATDTRSEKVGFKIREAQLEKIPYMLIVGDKDEEQKVVSVRCRKNGDTGQVSIEAFLEKIELEAKPKSQK